jgi:WD40 repeat protein
MVKVSMDKLLALSPELQQYNLKNMPMHLSNTGQTERFNQVLCSFQFLQAKLNAFSVMELVGNYDLTLAQQQESLRLIRRTLLLSAHILSEDKNQLAGQLIGRLLEFENIKIQLPDKKQEKLQKSLFGLFAAQRQNKTLSPKFIVQPKYPEINELLLGAKEWKPGTPWLRPLTPGLASPDAALIRVIPTGIDGWRNSAAITPNGRRVLAISGNGSNVIRVWDLPSGQEIFHLNTQSELSKIVLSSDGKQLISLGNKIIQVWDLSNRSESYKVEEDNFVEDIAISPNDNFLVSIMRNKLSAWNLKTGERSLSFDLPEWKWNRVTMTPDSRFAVVFSQGDAIELQGYPYVTFKGEIKFWDLSGEKAHFTLDEQIAVRSFVFTPDGTKLIYRRDHGVIKIWELSSRQCIRTIERREKHLGMLGQLAITLDGKLIISYDLDHRLTLLNIKSGLIEYEIEIPGEGDFLQMIVMPNGKEIMTVSQELRFLSIEHHEKNIPDVKRFYGRVEIAQDGKIGIIRGDEGKIRVWDFAKFEERKVFDIGDYTFLEITPDGKQGILGLSTHEYKPINMFQVIDLENGRSLRAFPGHDWASVFLSANSRWLFSHNADSDEITDSTEKFSLKVRSFATGKEHFTIKRYRDKACLLFGSYTLEPITATPNGNYLAFSAIENLSLLKEDQDLTKDDFIDEMSQKPIGIIVIKIWNLETGKESLTLRGHTDMIRRLIFDPRGRWLISGSDDASIRVWDFIQGAEIFRFTLNSGLCSMELSQNGKILITGNFDGSINLYDLENRQMLFSMQGHSSVIGGLAITADGKRFASGSNDKKVKIWDLTNMHQIASFVTEGIVVSCHFVNDGYTVVSNKDYKDPEVLHLENIQQG